AVFTDLADLKTYRFKAEDIEQMERLLLSQRLPAKERADLHSALGKAYGDEKLTAKSYGHYAKGNALRRVGADFDPGRMTAYRMTCEAVFTERFFSERQGWGCSSRAAIFIVGLPRSGSTLVEQMLASHSAIEGLGELFLLEAAVGRLFAEKDGKHAPHEFWIGPRFEFRKRLTSSLSDVVASLGAEDCGKLGEDYLALVQDRRVLGRPRFVDKELRNFGYAGFIHLALPNAKIVDVRRHPLDCGWSCFKTHFPSGQPFTDRLGDIGSHYANYARLMAHFDRVLPGRIHRVIYENLVADPEGELRLLFQYLELPFEETCLRFYENTRAVGTLSSEQVRTPLFETGIGQYKPYEPWLGPLKAALGDVLDKYPEPPAAAPARTA
ncbi:MAG: sulfotransferase, partial [Alphaproteobacteria bacterium]|nr:sulfotransferase [Alphaproteobacteria bacterium]